MQENNFFIKCIYIFAYKYQGNRTKIVYSNSQF